MAFLGPKAPPEIRKMGFEATGSHVLSEFVDLFHKFQFGRHLEYFVGA